MDKMETTAETEMAPLADPTVEEFPTPFLPQDSELLDGLLRPKIAGDHIDSRFRVRALRRRHLRPPPGPTGGGGDNAWYFFCPLVGAGSARVGGGRRWARAVGGDGSKRWCSMGSKKEVDGSAGGGYSQRFRYKEETALGVVAPRWMLVKFGVAQQHGGEGGAGLVLCKIFDSPRAARSESGSPSSCKSATAFPSASGSGSGGRRRKAEEDHLEAPPPSTRTPPLSPNAAALKPEGANTNA